MDVLAIRSQMHGMEASMARMMVMMEEQSARNKIAIDAAMTVIGRIDRVEQRMDQVEETVRSLATPTAPDQPRPE